MSDASKSDEADTKEYLFDMLMQLAWMAESCGEPDLALVLRVLVANRGSKNGQGGTGGLSSDPPPTGEFG